MAVYDHGPYSIQDLLLLFMATSLNNMIMVTGFNAGTFFFYFLLITTIIVHSVPNAVHMYIYKLFVSGMP